MRSRSSHSLSSYSAAASRLLRPSRLSYQSPSHSWTLLCRRLHLVTPLRRCPRRRLISLSPRYFLTWQCRRLPTVSTPHLWMLPCRRPHPVPCLSTFLRRRVLAQLPRFLLVCLCRLLYAVRCYMMLPHNYRSRSSSLAVFTRTVLWTAKTLFVSPRHQCKVHMPCCSHSQDSNSQPRLLSLPLTLTCLLHMVRLLTVLPAMPCSRLSVPLKWEHTLYAQLPAPKEVLVLPQREPTILLAPILVQVQAPSLNHGHWFFPWSVLGNPSPTDLATLPQLTVISCTINSAFPFFSGIQARRAEILPTLSPHASTELLQFLHAKMREHNVDFIGGDFNMSAFSTVSDVFSDPEFQLLVIHVCGGSVRWMNSIGNVLASSSCPSAHMNGVWIHMAAASLTMQRLALDPGINLLTSLCFSTFATPIFLDPAVLCAVSRHNKEGMIANITKLSVPRNVARDHAPGRLDVRNDSWFFVVSWLLPFYISESRFCDPVVHAVYSVPMCALVGLMVPRRPLVAKLSHDERALVWALLIESGHIPLRTILGNCSRDLYRPLRLRLLAWAQQVVFQDLHHIWAILHVNRS